MAEVKTKKHKELLLHGFDGGVLPPPSLNSVVEAFQRVKNELSKLGDDVLRLCEEYKKLPQKFPVPPKAGEYLRRLTPPPKPPVYAENFSSLPPGEDEVSS